MVRADPHIGFLHRGTEKLVEFKSYLQAVPYLDRLDYVSMMVQEHAFVLAVEQLARIVVPRRASIIRVLFSEITRILNHIMAVTTHAMDVGALTPFLWAFEERELLMEIYERVSGGRMHAAYFRPGGVAFDMTQETLDLVAIFANKFPHRLYEIEELLSGNRIWAQRLRGVGVITPAEATSRGLSGVLLRSCGLSWDLRKATPYEVYGEIPFQVPVGRDGDCFDRYRIRMAEMFISVDMMKTCLSMLTPGPTRSLDLKKTMGGSRYYKYSMEGLIHHFKAQAGQVAVSPGEVYAAVEAPKGEFGISLVSDGGNRPYRCKIRSPGFMHLQSFDYMCYNHFLADITTIIGTQDIVFGEVDR